MGFNLNKAMSKKEEIKNSFIPIELNEDNIQEIFNKCIANATTKTTVTSSLFPTALGYERGSEKLIRFDKDLLLENKATIEYLFGQLHRVHNPNGSFKMSIDDFNTTYQNTHWTSDKAALLKLLYLGVTPEVLAISPFSAATSLSVITPQVKPTLSPKDPNFQAWWEDHKVEWESRKKGGQEPADD